MKVHALRKRDSRHESLLEDALRPQRSSYKAGWLVLLRFGNERAGNRRPGDALRAEAGNGDLPAIDTFLRVACNQSPNGQGVWHTSRYPIDWHCLLVAHP